MGAEQLTREFISTTFQRRLDVREAQASILLANKLTTPQIREEQYDRLASIVGNTPLLGLQRPNGLILAKVESQNASETHYDRAYLATLRRLEKDSIIQPGDELLEITSGSAGTSFAWLCSRLGYKAHILVPPELPLGRVQEMRNFGAMVEVSQPGYVPQTAEELRAHIQTYKQEGYEVTKHKTDDYFVLTAQKGEHRVCLVNHSENMLTVNAFGKIGHEVRDIIPQGVNVDYFVSVLGNWTTTMGISRTLREGFSGIKVIGVEDPRNPNYFDEKYSGRFEQEYGHVPIFGSHDSYGASARGTRLRFANVKTIEEIRLVDLAQRDRLRAAYNSGQQLIDTIGNTSAASLWVAEQLLEEQPGSIVLVTFYDKADRYGQPILAKTPAVFDAARHPLFEVGKIQKPHYQQTRAVNPLDLPRDLRQAYNDPQHVTQVNLEQALRKAA